MTTTPTTQIAQRTNAKRAEKFVTVSYKIVSLVHILAPTAIPWAETALVHAAKAIFN